MSKIRIFKLDSCLACQVEVPQVLAMAKKLRIKAEVVDVDKCPVSVKRECDRIAFVPTVELDGREISKAELQRMVNEKANAK